VSKYLILLEMSNFVKIYLCVVPEDELLWHPTLWRQLNRFVDIKDGMFLYTTNDLESFSGITIPIKGEVITHTVTNSNEDIYNFSPSNITLNINYGGDEPLIKITIGKFKISPIWADQDEEDDDLLAEENPITLKITSYLNNIIEKEKAREKGREVASLKELGASRQLPENMESVIGSYLTGKKGTLNAQINRIKQNSGIPIAPRFNSKTRKNRKSRKRMN